MNFSPPNQFLKNVSTVAIWIIYLADDVICGRNAWNAVAVQYVKNNHRQSGCITSLEGRLEFISTCIFHARLKRRQIQSKCKAKVCFPFTGRRQPLALSGSPLRRL